MVLLFWEPYPVFISKSFAEYSKKLEIFYDNAADVSGLLDVNGFSQLVTDITESVRITMEVDEWMQQLNMDAVSPLAHISSALANMIVMGTFSYMAFHHDDDIINQKLGVFVRNVNEQVRWMDLIANDDEQYLM